MSSRDCQNCQHQATIDRLALELARLQAEHRRTVERLERAERRALRYRWVAEQIHHAALGRDDQLQEKP